MGKEIGYTDVSETPPHFSLSEVMSAFPEARHISARDREYILDPNGETILLFLKNNEGNVTQIYSPRSSSELTKMILGLKKDHTGAYNYISSVMKLPSPSVYDLQAYERERAKISADQRRLEAAMGEHVEYVSRNFDQGSTRGVLQGEYGITDATSSINTIGTFGAGPCIMIFIRRPEQQHPQTGEMIPARAAIAHFDAMTTVHSLNNFMHKLNTNEKLEVTLISGELDRSNILRVLDFFAGKNVTLKTDFGNGTQNAVMVVKTGQIIRDAMPLNNGENVDLRLFIAGLKSMNGSIGQAFDSTDPKYDVNFNPSPEIIRSPPTSP